MNAGVTLEISEEDCVNKGNRNQWGATHCFPLMFLNEQINMLGYLLKVLSIVRGNSKCAPLTG